MNYLDLLHDLRLAIKATMPLLLARYQTISFPGSRINIKEDNELTQLIHKLDTLQHSAENIQRSINDGLINGTDDVAEELLLDKLLN